MVGKGGTMFLGFLLLLEGNPWKVVGRCVPGSDFHSNKIMVASGKNGSCGGRKEAMKKEVMAVMLVRGGDDTGLAWEPWRGRS